MASKRERERERERADLHAREENKGFEKRCRTEPKWDREIRGPRDRKLHRQHQLVLCIRRRSNSQSSKRHCFIDSGQIFKRFFGFFLLCVVVVVVLLLLLQRYGIWLWVSCALFWIFCVAVDGVDGSGI